MPYGQAATADSKPGQQRNVYRQPVADASGAPLPAQPRPNGTWDASVALAGIDAHHDFVTNRRMTAPFGPDSRTDNQPAIGGYSGSIPHKGPANLLYDGEDRDQRDYWQDRYAGKVRAYAEEDFSGGDDLRSGTGDITRPRDARQFSIPTDDRPTMHSGPQMGYMMRAGAWLFGQFRAARFNGDHASYAFTPSMRPSPLQYGDGVGSKRFRPTSRQSPDPMMSQVVTTELDSISNQVDIFSAGSLPKYW